MPGGVGTAYRGAGWLVRAESDRQFSRTSRQHASVHEGQPYCRGQRDEEEEGGQQAADGECDEGEQWGFQLGGGPEPEDASFDSSHGSDDGGGHGVQLWADILDCVCVLCVLLSVCVCVCVCVCVLSVLSVCVCVCVCVRLKPS